MSTRSSETPPSRFGIRRPARSTVALALVVVLGTAALLWAAAGLGRVGAQSLLTRLVQQRTGVEQPEVQVRGAFLLPQVIRGRYDDVQVDLASTGSGPLRLTDVHAELRGVRLPFHDVLVQDVHRVEIAHVTEDATVTWDDLNRYLRLTSRPVTVSPTGTPGEVRLVGAVRVLGRTVDATAEATVAADGDGVAIRPTRVETGVTGLDRASRLLLAERFAVRIPLLDFPFGRLVTAVTTERDGLHVRAIGDRIVLDA